MLCFCICFRLIESLVTIHHGARSLVSLSFRSIRADAPSVVSVLTSSLCIPICAHYCCPFNSSIHTMESNNLCRRIGSSAGLYMVDTPTISQRVLTLHFPYS